DLVGQVAADRRRAQEPVLPRLPALLEHAFGVEAHLQHPPGLDQIALAAILGVHVVTGIVVVRRADVALVAIAGEEVLHEHAALTRALAPRVGRRAAARQGLADSIVREEHHRVAETVQALKAHPLGLLRIAGRPGPRLEPRPRDRPAVAVSDGV